MGSKFPALGPTAINAAKTHCVHGHELYGDNLIVTYRGRRHCRACQKEHARKYEKRRKESASSRVTEVARIPDYLEYVLARSATVPESGCWIWLGQTCSSDGYARRSYKKGGCTATASVHREVWEHANGPIPEGMSICHKCDTRSCVNPDHLYAGTHKDNMRDKSERFAFTPFTIKLSNETADEIRQSGMSTKALARAYGVTPKTIRNVRQRQTWIRK